MQEVNEVVQKVYGGEKPVPIWLEDNDTNRSAPVKRILFSLTVKMRVNFLKRLISYLL